MFHVNRVNMTGIVTICLLSYANCLAVVSMPPQEESPVSTIAALAEAPGLTIDPKFSPPPWFKNQTVSNKEGLFLYVQTEAPCSNPLEAENELDDDCCVAIAEIIDQWYQPGAGGKVAIDRDYIKQHLVFDDRMVVMQYKDQHTEELCRSFGKDYEYFRGYSQLLLSDEFRADVKERWKTQQMRSRVLQCGFIGASCIGLLLVFFGYFRLEHATRGFYSGRLQMACIVIVLILSAGVFWLIQAFQIF